MDLIQVKDNALCDPLAEAYPQPMCDSATGTTFIRWFGTLNGVPNGTHVDTTLAGAAYVVGDESLVTYGECIADCAPVCPVGVTTTWSSVCPEPNCLCATACYEVCTSTTSTPTYYSYQLYDVDQAYPEFKNLTYTAGAATDGQYEISVTNGRWAPMLNMPINPSFADYARLSTPLLVYEKAITGMSTSCKGSLEFDLYEISNYGNFGQVRAQVVDTTSGAILATADYDCTKSWEQHTLDFTGFASGGVTVRFYSLRNGSATGNDFCIDDIIVSQVPCSCVTYKMVSENCVTTWYDSNNAVITAPDLTNAVRISCTAPAPSTSVCYEKTTTTKSSPANDTKLITEYVGFACTTDLYGTSSGTGGFNSVWSAYNSTTPMVINDDNGVPCSSHVRLDQNDAIQASFQAYSGVVYAFGGILRKVQADGLGAASIRVDLIRPDNTVVSNIASGSSTREGGGGGWDQYGSFAGGGLFTANQTGTWKVVVYGTSTAPARTTALQLKVSDASGEVGTTVTTFYKKVTTSGVDTWYDVNNNVISAPDITGFSVVTCP